MYPPAMGEKGRLSRCSAAKMAAGGLAGTAGLAIVAGDSEHPSTALEKGGQEVENRTPFAASELTPLCHPTRLRGKRAATPV